MNILAIETTGPLASVAVINDKQEVREKSSDRKLSHLQNLVPMIGDLLEDCELQLDNLTHIAVSEGPGSFTGIRIGIATAKALAQVLGLPAIAVPTLRAFAWNVPDFGGLYCPVFDARRSQVYAGAYYWQNGLCMQAVKDGAYSIEEFLDLVEDFDKDHPKRVMVFGDGANFYLNAVEVRRINTGRISPNDDLSVIPAENEYRFQKASSVAGLAFAMAKEGAEKKFSEIVPVYLRKAEAERKLEEKLKKVNK